MHPGLRKKSDPGGSIIPRSRSLIQNTEVLRFLALFGVFSAPPSHHHYHHPVHDVLPKISLCIVHDSRVRVPWAMQCSGSIRQKRQCASHSVGECSVPQTEHIATNMSTEKSTTRDIPIVDLGELGIGASKEPREEEWQRVARELKDAFSRVGFVYLDNHGIPSALVETLFKTAAKFFNLDLDTKTKYSKRDYHYQNGYVSLGREQLDDKDSKHLELRESFDQQDTELGLFPDEELPELKAHMKALEETCCQLLPNLFTAMSLALGQDRDFFTLSHQKLLTAKQQRISTKDLNMTTMRLNYYPPVPSSTPENSIRCGTHSDYGSITLLFQDSIGGLQVQDVSGTWVEATPIPGTILVNVGDLLEMWTAGKFIATKHRILIPEDEVRLKKARQSIVYFLNPDNDLVIKPLDHSGKYPPIKTWDYLDKRLNSTYGYGN